MSKPRKVSLEEFIGWVQGKTVSYTENSYETSSGDLAEKAYLNDGSVVIIESEWAYGYYVGDVEQKTPSYYIWE